MIGILLKEEYGILPPAPEKLFWLDLEEERREGFCILRKKVFFTLRGRGSSFPVSFVIPEGGEKIPSVFLIDFVKEIPNRYFPVDLLIKEGYGAVHLCYEDISSDSDDFTEEKTTVFFPEGRREEDCGKLGLWSWGIQRVMDLLERDPGPFDLTRAVLAGHSRLGKCVLLTAAIDRRFTCVCSNDSGCGGAALFRGKKGEKIADITGLFPYWFKSGFRDCSGREGKLPFDQHYLLASIAPRKVLVSSAEEDLWADPVSEYLSALAASDAFEKGIKDSLPKAGDRYQEGDIAFQMRKGGHFFAEEDWKGLLAWAKEKSAART